MKARYTEFLMIIKWTTIVHLVPATTGVEHRCGVTGAGNCKPRGTSFVLLMALELISCSSAVCMISYPRVLVRATKASMCGCRIIDLSCVSWSEHDNFFGPDANTTYTTSGTQVALYSFK